MNKEPEWIFLKHKWPTFVSQRYPTSLIIRGIQRMPMMIGRVVQVVEYLPSKCEDWSSNTVLSTTRKKYHQNPNDIHHRH
jgi:hypothetical protein